MEHSWMSSTTAAADAIATPACDEGCRTFADEVARVCHERGSWRRRLEWVRDVLRDGRADAPAVLAYLGVFLKLVATSAIPSKEDGGHYRPSHHAGLGLEIEQLLLTGPRREQRALVRGILRWLPSHDSPFRRAEPLTRIRDIAHRNDIPRELKDEIKTTLQNKLHRSAGPEDLETSARLLARFTQPDAALPAAFVDEFRRFHDELSAFFNAGSLDEDLRRLLPDLPDAARAPATELLAVFPQPLATPARIDRELACITNLRRALEPAFTQPDQPLGQKLRLLDLKLDERAFVLVAERANRLAAGSDPTTVDGLLALLAEVAQQLAISGVETELMRVLAVPVDTTAPTDELLRRARARFETAHTVLGRYATRVLGECAAFAAELAGRLDLPAYVAEQHAAREIRGNLAFQLSRLVDRGLATTAHALGLSGWQAVVPGRAQGQLLAVEQLDQLPDGDQPALVVVAHLDGDEDLSPRVRALLVGHDLPHLSHVAIRARQGNVPMAARPGGQPLEEALAARMGQRAAITVDADGVHVGAATDEHDLPPSRQLRLGPASPTDRVTLIDLEHATAETAGGKAWGARRLAATARDQHAPFRSPTGFVVPFGVMEACLALDPQRSRQRDELLAWVDDPARPDWQDAGARLRNLIETMPLPESLLRELGQRAAALDRIAVRSSSNAEDRKDAVGAGVFDSVIGAVPSEIPSALRRVWASLYGRRALAISRAGRASARQLRMAVLIQPVVPAELSFVMYTRSPFASNAHEAYVELAAGLGEVLAGASGEGSPYRLHIDRVHHTYRLTSLLSYPDAVVLGEDGGLRQRPVAFHELRFEHDGRWRQSLVDRLAEAAELVERELGGPQDVEGAVVGDDLWFLQSRPAAVPSEERA